MNVRVSAFTTAKTKTTTISKCWKCDGKGTRLAPVGSAGTSPSTTAHVMHAMEQGIEYQSRRSPDFSHGLRVLYHLVDDRQPRKTHHLEAFFRTPEELMRASMQFDLAFLQAGYVAKHRIKVI